MPDKIFDDLEPVEEAAEELRKHPRTIMRWTKLPDDPLPVFYVGKTPYLRPSFTQAWIERRRGNSRGRAR